MRNHTPTVILVTLLALVGLRVIPIGSTSPSGSRTPGEGSDSGVEVRLPPGKDRPAPPAVQRRETDGDGKEAAVSEEFWKPLLDFTSTLNGPETGRSGKGFPIPSGWDLEFIIATMPDPIDSRSGYQFDSLVDAIQRAVETQDFVLDRFFYPWPAVSGPKETATTSKESEASGWQWTVRGPRRQAQFSLTPISAGTSGGRLSERQPGVLLFKQQADPDDLGKPATGHLLMVMLVGETATAGIHKVAFKASLDFIANYWKQKNRPSPEILVLGPHYSGSQLSLAASIRAWAMSHSPSPGFGVISGSATALDQKTFLKECMNGARFQPNQCLSFRATVIPEDMVLLTLLKHLGLTSSEQDGEQLTEPVAVLIEANTGFGSGLRSGLRSGLNLTKGPRLVFYPFPMHISDERVSYKQADKEGVDLPRLPAFGSRLGIPSENNPSANDTEPSLFPAMAAVTTERGLALTLEAIARERYRYVVIEATDVRDQIFLATLVRQNCPGIRLLFTSADLLLSHPDHAFYLNGSIVGSTYPFYPRNQSWSYPFGGQNRLLVLQGQAEQGYYNATLALLSYRGAGYSVGEYFLEYGPPFQPSAVARPPVWISILRQGGPQPLDAIAPVEKDGKLRADYNNFVFDATAVGRPEKAEEANSETTKPVFTPRYGGIWTNLFVLFTLFVLAVAWACAFQVRQYLWPAAPSHATAHSRLTDLLWSWSDLPGASWQRHIRALYTLVCLTAVLAAYAYLAFVCAIPLLWQDDNKVVSMAPWQYGIPVVAFVVAGLYWSLAVAAALTCLVPREAPAAGKALKEAPHKPSYGPGSILVTGVTLTAVLSLYLGWTAAANSKPATLFRFERATNLASGESPVVPVLVLGIAFFAWGRFQLKKLYLLQHHSVPQPFAHRLGGAEVLRGRHKNLGRALRRPLVVIREHPGFSVLAGLTLLYVVCRLGTRYVPTPEGPYFDWLLLPALAVLALLLVYALFQTWILWKWLRELLHAMGRLRMGPAYNRIPQRIVNAFGPYLTSTRPGRQVNLVDRKKQWALVVSEYELLAEKRTEAPIRDHWPLLRAGGACTALDQEPEPGKVATDDEKLAWRARICSAKLHGFWAMLSVGEARGEFPSHGEASENDSEKKGTSNSDATGPKDSASPWHAETPQVIQRWLTLAEDFVALEFLVYLSQFFVQLKNYAVFLTCGAMLFLFAILSYPFQPQRHWLLFAAALVLLVAGVLFWIFVQMERDEVVSRISKTMPNQLNFHWSFVGNVLTYTLPLLGVAAVASPTFSDMLHSWFEPLLQLLR
jgi:hypothetical protein